MDIWLVEDEAAIADTLLYTLKRDGFTVQWFDHAGSFLMALQQNTPDLVILDVGLPDMHGFDLAKKLPQDLPFLFLTARSEEVDKLIGLEIGADDYIAKPFSPREISARIRTILRRVQRPVSKDLGHFTLQEDSATILFHATPLMLTRYEFLLLKTLLLSPNRIFSRQQLMDLVWANEESFDRTVDTHIKTLRAKLRTIAPDSDPIITHRGLGYRLSLSA